MKKRFAYRGYMLEARDDLDLNPPGFNVLIYESDGVLCMTLPSQGTFSTSEAAFEMAKLYVDMSIVHTRDRYQIMKLDKHRRPVV